MNDIEKYKKIFGGDNKINPPFNIGDILIEKYKIDDANNIIEGDAEFEFMGMKGDMMLIKTLNKEAIYDTRMNKKILNDAIKSGFKPKLGSTLQLHYMYADRFNLKK